MKILLIDDSRTEALVLKSYLSSLEHELEVAESGEQGLALFKQQRFELVLLDILLPGIDGFAVAKQLRGISSDWVPIIFLSGQNSPTDIQKAIDAGGDDYLTKPVSRVVLGAKMRAMQRLANMRTQLLTVTSQLEIANQELAKLATIDGLTGLANRRELDVRLAQVFARATRQNEPLCMLMCDVDWFKQYNDHYGHLLGDDCLKQISHLLEETVQRPDDLAARFGGEEFAILLSNTPIEGAKHLAQNIIQQLDQLAIAHHQSPLGKVSLSIGIACMSPRLEQHATELIAAADQALYQAKQNGRNRYTVYTEPN